MSKYINPEFASLEAYVPGEQPQDRKYIKLNTNESPYPAGPGVVEAISPEQVQRLCLYSDPESKALKKALSDVYGMPTECIFVSNGSDEILNFAFMLYAKQNGAAFPDISYGFYKVFGELYSVDCEQIPLTDSFEIDPSQYMNKGKFVVIANPNAPTGIELGEDVIEEIIKSNQGNVVLIDEAYIDFGGKSCYKLTQKYDNLIVCQTFSKSRSLAGARLGFCFASKEIIDDLEKIKFSTNPYNINRLTQAAGVAALKENGYYMENCRKIADTRAYVTKEMQSLGFEVLPSSANFIFARHPDFSGEEIYSKLREKGILVRHFTSKRICEFNRITIGSREEMESFIEAVQQIIKGE